MGQDIVRQEQPRVSVICMAYNHARYIRQALDGFVTQKTDFPFEVIIHDDASTDGTQAIIREYEEKYPDIIKPIYQTENQWCKGGHISKTYVYPKIKGEYVALCEGDDYWTDPLKLQKQVDLLDKHQECSLCYHTVLVTWEGGEKADKIFPSKRRHRRPFSGLKDLLKSNYIQTNSVLYRWRFHRESFELLPSGILPGDWFLHLLHAETGKICFIPDVMAVYRRHSGGIWYNVGKTEDFYFRKGVFLLSFYESVQKHFRVDRRAEIDDVARKTVKAILLGKDFERLRRFSERHEVAYQAAVSKGFRNAPKGILRRIKKIMGVYK